MDFEQKYNAVLKTATQWIKDGCTDKEKICLECVFPELQKGIDERVIDVLRELGTFDVANELYEEFGITYTDVLYWLEMQKELIHIKKLCKENGDSFIDDDEATRKAILAVKMVEEYIDRYLTNAHDIKDDDPRKDYCRGVDSTLADINDILQNIYSEKQKENPKSDDSIPSNCVSDAKCEDRWHKVQDFTPADGRLVLAKDNIGNYLLASFAGGEWFVERYDLDDVPMRHTYVTEWCEIPSEKQKEQKKPTLDDPDLYGDWDNDLLEEIHSWLGHLDGKYTPYTIDDIKLTAWHFVEWQKQKGQKPNIELIQQSWYMEGYHDREFGKEPKWILKTGEGGPKHELNPKYGQFLQKPAEWSDTKELVFKDICNHLKEEGYSGWVLLLNALRNGEFQPKPEWSKEDEMYLSQAIETLEHENYLILADKLKSLKSSWKPSKDEERLINTSISFLKDFADKGYENAVECIDWLKSKLNGNTCK